MLRVALLVAVIAAIASPALGAAVAPRCVEVIGDSVTVRDLLLPGAQADGVGEEVLERVVLTGLNPGEQSLLTPGEIYLRLAELGLDPTARGWSWSQSVLVTRRSQVISRADLVAAGEEAIRAQLDLCPDDQAFISPVMAPRPLLAPVGPVRLEALVQSPRLRGGLWTANLGVMLDHSRAADCTLRYRVTITGPVLVTRRAVRRHESLAEEDFAFETRELTRVRGTPLRVPEALSGLRAARAVAAGTVVTSEWSETIPAVRRNQLVCAAAQVGRVRATTRVVALADGILGEVIRVRTEADRREFLARVVAPGQVEVVVLP